MHCKIATPLCGSRTRAAKRLACSLVNAFFNSRHCLRKGNIESSIAIWSCATRVSLCGARLFVMTCIKELNFLSCWAVSDLNEHQRSFATWNFAWADVGLRVCLVHCFLECSNAHNSESDFESLCFDTLVCKVELVDLVSCSPFATLENAGGESGPVE